MSWLKSIWEAVVSFLTAFFAGVQAERIKELEREKEQATIQAGRIVGRADNAGELSKHFRKRAEATNDNENADKG